MTVADSTEPRVVPRPEHDLSRKSLSEGAQKVLYRLNQKGQKAYLVGGSVRDILLGREPKDFDIATDAKPNEVRRLFRNSRVIGRRFRLVHVYFKDGLVEVSTFRRDPDPDAQGGGDDELLITDDNVFGDPREDAFRRDFTVNALFYDISDFSVIDYVDGLKDLKNGVIRAIGDPGLRFQEDPVRMMRACEYAGRLGFTIAQATQQAIHDHRHDLEKAATPRVTEELGELLRCGHAGRSLQWMLDLGLLEVLLPEAYAMVSAGEKGLGEFGRILPSIDAMTAAGRKIEDTALYGALLLPTVILRRHDVEAIDRRVMSRGVLEKLVAEVVDPFFARFTLSGLKAEHVRNAIMAFHRLGETRWKPGEKERFARRGFFDDALFLFEVMVSAMGEGAAELEAWREVRNSVGGGKGGRGGKSGKSGRAKKGGGSEGRPRRRRRPRRKGRES